MATSKSSQSLTIRWENRKWMAWTSLAAFLLYTLLYWFALPPLLDWFAVRVVWVAAIQDSYFWFATGTIAAVLGYMGFTTLPFLGRGGSAMPAAQTGIDEEEPAPAKKKKKAADDDDSLFPQDGYVDPNFKFESKDL